MSFFKKIKKIQKTFLYAWVVVYYYIVANYDEWSIISNYLSFTGT
jgi:hypothetical protein